MNKRKRCYKFLINGKDVSLEELMNFGLEEHEYVELFGTKRLETEGVMSEDYTIDVFEIVEAQ